MPNINYKSLAGAITLFATSAALVAGMAIRHPVALAAGMAVFAIALIWAMYEFIERARHVK